MGQPCEFSGSDREAALELLGELDLEFGRVVAVYSHSPTSH
jgi:hypothetical protein